MTDLQKDFLTGIVFMTGLVGFISGEFIISSTAFAVASVANYININHKKHKSNQYLWDYNGRYKRPWRRPCRPVWEWI